MEPVRRVSDATGPADDPNPPAFPSKQLQQQSRKEGVLSAFGDVAVTVGPMHPGKDTDVDGESLLTAFGVLADECTAPSTNGGRASARAASKDRETLLTAFGAKTGHSTK